MANKKYNFSDLFDADRNLTPQGKAHRAKIQVRHLVELEKMYPKK